MSDRLPTETEPDASTTDDERRMFLQALGGTAVTATGLSGAATADNSGPDGKPELSTVPLSHGVATGEVTAREAIVWTRAAGDARVHALVAEAGSAEEVRHASAVANQESDYTVQIRVSELEPATRYRYRILAVESGTDDRNWTDGKSRRGFGGRQTRAKTEAGNREADRGSKNMSGRSHGNNRTDPNSNGKGDGRRAAFDEAATGTFVTAPESGDDGAVSFAWSGDTWGYGDDPIEPPYPGFEAIAERRPDFFLYLGDTIYADADTPAGKITEDTPVDSALPIYRDKYKEMRSPPEEVAPRSNLQRLLRATSVYAMWDDHEVINNFAGPVEPLMPAGRRAFGEYWPIDRGEDEGESKSERLYGSFRWGKHLELFILDTRQYRDPNVDEEPKTLLGDEQLGWLKESLAESDATWKVLASPAPLGHPSDSWATPADRTGYESELLDVVTHVQREGVSNVVSVAGDVHHSQVGAFDPDGDGNYELYEAIAGPLGAPAGEPDDFYAPLNPTEFFAKGGYANFGTVTVDESGETLTIEIHDEHGERQFSKTITATDADGGEPPSEIESGFETGADGWLVSNNGGSNQPVHHADDGNPAGHVSDVENQGGAAWYYQAPFKFLGDRKSFYGGTLSFDLRQEQMDQQFDPEPTDGGDVVLASRDRTLVYEFRGPDATPKTEWTSFEVALTGDAGWIDLDSKVPFATEAVLRSVLGDLRMLRIRGEYRSGDDTSYLDNVVLTRD